jgi:hypothetical protein
MFFLEKARRGGTKIQQMPIHETSSYNPTGFVLDSCDTGLIDIEHTIWRKLYFSIPF